MNNSLSFLSYKRQKFLVNSLSQIPTLKASTIEEVLAALDQIIDQTIQENNYLGIFAYVYRRTTAGIQQAIHEDAFEDSARMELFDVHFANYYIKASM